MSGDPLYEPLGTATRKTSRGASRIVVPVLGIAAIVAGLGAWSVAHRAARSDQAVAVATIAAEPRLPPAAPPVGDKPGAIGPVAVVAAAPPSSPPGSTVEVQNGVKIIRFNPTASAASIMVPVDRAAAGPLKAAPDPRVSEKTPGGVLPRIAADGTRPSDVYARPAAATRGPRVALLLTGMGIDQMATADATRRLSPDLSFGFGDAVADAAAQVAESRRGGHEVFLDVSTAPTSASTVGVIGAALRAAMGRFTGYVGLVVPGEAAAATLQETVARGVLPVSAVGGPLPVGGGQIVMIDAGAGAESTSAALDKLIATARQKGSALGIVTQANRALDPLEGFSARAAAEGVSLVPASAVLARKGEDMQAAP